VGDALSLDGQPLITVAMPIYNAGQYLRLAVLSIVKQTYSHLELLIVDDGSTDDALSDIQDILASDTRVRVISDGQNKGLAARLNECIDLARGDYIARMDQDDVSYPERFTKQIQMLESNIELDLVAVRAITISEQNGVVGTLPWHLSYASICSRPWQGCYLPHPTWMGRAVWFKKYRYAEPAHYFCEDQELLLRSYAASQFATVAEVLFAYRIRSVVNAIKLRKTRIAVFRMQWQQFLSKKQYRFAMLSALVLIGRVLMDKKNNFYSSTRQTESDDVIKQWSDVLKQIGQENIIRSVV
jgi:glycosyltransferase involved in cell wall biosynthesis